MAVTFFGKAHNPATDNTDSGTRQTATVTPPASMTEGDLVYAVSDCRNGTAALSVGVTGGQTWTPLTSVVSNGVSRGFYCRFNGTWDADPRFDQSAAANAFAVFMAVFRPTDTDYTWAVDVAEVAAGYSAPTGDKDVTITGIETLTDGAVVLAAWTSNVAHTWTLQTVGWTNPGSLAQLRELAGSDVSISLAYQIKATAGTTGDVTNRQVTGAAAAGTQRIIAFKEVAPAAAADRALMYARRPRSRGRR